MPCVNRLNSFQARLVLALVLLLAAVILIRHTDAWTLKKTLIGLAGACALTGLILAAISQYNTRKISGKLYRMVFVYVSMVLLFMAVLFAFQISAADLPGGYMQGEYPTSGFFFDHKVRF